MERGAGLGRAPESPTRLRAGPPGQGHITAIAARDMGARTCSGRWCSRAGTGGPTLARLPSSPLAVLWKCPAQVQVSCLAGSRRRHLAFNSLTLETCVSCWRFPLLFCQSWLRPAGPSLGRSAWPQPRAAGARPATRFSSFSLSGNLSLSSLFSILQFIYGVAFISTGLV